MYSKTPPNKIKKRPHEDSNTERLRRSPLDEDVNCEVSDTKVVSTTPRINMSKRARDGSSTKSCEVVHVEDDSREQTRVFKFRVLLPNGTSVELKMTELRSEVSIEEFIRTVRKEYSLLINQKKSLQLKRRINWEYQDLSLTDVNSKRIRLKIDFREFTRSLWHLLWLHDGSAEPEEYEDMWDLTPDTDLLRELPDDYTCETALADLIDNSLQALWSNARNSRRLISVEMHQEKISIFDSGPGMDGANGNLVKWGKMGASLHRTVREEAVGGEPPYLVPFFGMFGYGGPVATMCLGRKVLVSSKTKRSKKVFTMHMEREALVSASSNDNCWKTKGGVRDPHENEMLDSPHGSFTLVEIFGPKLEITTLSLRKLRYKLKDIYFPYIQCDEMSGKTSTPVEFQVNGKDLAEIQGGEVATTNLHSSNGPDFIVQLHFSIRLESSSMASQNQRVPIEANARLKCVYFPIVKGEENIQRILDKLDKDGCGIGESFESFSRVSIRRLGRLLPDTRWALLPFMEPKQKRGEKTHIMKRHCSRVKCFIDTDSGFNPTPHKTDLAHQHPYTKALKNFGKISPEDEKEVHVEITRDGNKLTLPQLQKLYFDWISEMHGLYDEETSDGMDEPKIVILPPSMIKELGMTSLELRVHKEIQRKGRRWTAGQNIKVLKGACAKCHKSNVFATLEYIFLEWLPGDTSGEARLICRPVGVPENRGCQLSLDDKGCLTVDINESLVFPLRIIDSEKCIPVNDIEWAKKVESVNQKLPAAIEILSHSDCQLLEIDGGLPVSVEAGDAPPDNIVAVIRPKFFIQGSSSKISDQKFIVRINHEMTLEIKRGDTEEHIYSVRIPVSSHNGLHGLYIFQLGTKWPKLFQKPGNLRFSFSVAELKDITLEHGVQIRASAEVGRWKIVNHDTNGLYTARVGSTCTPLSIACYDRHKKRIPFTSIPELEIKLISSGKTLAAQIRNEKVDITDKSTLKIKEFLIYSRELDTIRPNYEATFNISTLDGAFSTTFPCRVVPGAPRRIEVHPTDVQKQLLPGQIIEELSLEVFDQYGNHVKKHESISLRLDGFSFKERSGIIRREGIDYMMVDAKGYVDLSNVLKVSKGYGKDVFLSVISKDEVIFKLLFRTEKRELRAVQKEFKNCEGGSLLENIAFEIVDSEGKVDESFNSEEKHWQSHNLEIKSTSICIDDSEPIRFRRGHVTIPPITLPDREGVFILSAVHSRYPELNCNTKVYVVKTRRDSVTNHGDVGNPVRSAKRLSSKEPQKRSSDILQNQVVDNASQIPGKLSGSACTSQKAPFKKTREENHDSASNHKDVRSPIQSTRRSSEHEQTLMGSPSLSVPFKKTQEENHESAINHENVGSSIRSTRRSSEHDQTLLGSCSLMVPFEKTRKANHDSAINHENVGSSIRSTRRSSEHDQTLLVSPSLMVPFEKTRKANHDSAINHEDVGSSILSTGRVSTGYEQTLLESPSLKTPEKNNGIAVNHNDVGSPILSTIGSSEHGQTLLESPSFRVSQVMNETTSPHSIKGLQSPASASSTFKTPKMEHTKAQGGSPGYALISLEELENDMINSSSQNTIHSTKLETLNSRQLELEHEISYLRVLIGPDLGNSSSTCGQKSISEQIKNRSQSAAAVICKMPEEELRRRDIVGVVALLGTVRSIELSRMLAQYLGEDQMLAIVCRSNEASYSLDSNMLNKFATELGLSINGGYLAFCLENIRPSSREPSIDLQMPLPLQPPTLPNGITPQGFLGYAVNLMNIEPIMQYLRETLFYRLFGELQVYQNRDCMMAAQSCINAGAVSLDGGMMRGNGLICLGHWQPKILFPVMTSVSSENLRRMERLEKLELELVKIKQCIDVEGEAFRLAEKQLKICIDKYNKCKSQNRGHAAAAISQSVKLTTTF